MTGFVFMTHDAADELFRSPGQTSFVLVGTADPQAVERRLDESGLTVLTRAEIAGNDRELFTGIFGSPLRLMVGVAFVVGALVIALTVYAAVAERRREFGMIKAIGASGGFVTGVVVRQALLLTALGLVVGLALFGGVQWLLATIRPQFSIVLTSGGMMRAVVAAALMGLIAAVVPARAVARQEPATIYRGR